MAKVYLYRSGFSFLPAYASDTDIMYRFKENEVFSCEVKRERNYKNHKRFFALLKLGFESQDKFTDMGWFREWILIKSGNFESCETPTGIMYRARSISFANMDELEFQELYKSVSQVIIEVCKITKSDIENNLNLFL